MSDSSPFSVRSAREPQHEPLSPDRIYSAREVAEWLGIARSTFYTLEWFKPRKRLISPRRAGYLGSDIILYQRIQKVAA